MMGPAAFSQVLQEVSAQDALSRPCSASDDEDVFRSTFLEGIEGDLKPFASKLVTGHTRSQAVRKEELKGTVLRCEPSPDGLDADT